MRSKILGAILLALAATCAYGQRQGNGILYASDFSAWTLPQGTSPTMGMMQWTSAICHVSSNGYTFVAPKTGRPLTIVDVNPALTETVIPTNVVDNGGTCTVSAPMTYTHISYSVKSGTAGMQEAIDYSANLNGGSVVILTPGWTVAGGTTSMIGAAYGQAITSILDERVATLCSYGWNGSTYAGTGCNTNAVSLTELTLQTMAGPLASPGFFGPLTGNVTGNLTGNVTGNLTGSVTGHASLDCALVGCGMTGPLTAPQVNGIYYCPTTSTLSACLATLPGTGGTLTLATGTYQVGSFSPCMSTPNVTIIGAGTPQYNSGNTALVGGTIIQGSVFICANNIAVKNLGVDVGSAWVGLGNSPADGLVFSGPTGTGTDPILVGASIQNVVALGSSPTSPFHTIRVEHYSGVTLNNTEGRMAQHSLAIKSSKVNLNGHKFQGDSVDGLVIKGDDYTQISDINVQNVQGTWAATPGDTNGIQITASGTAGTVSRVSINTLTTNGVLYDVSLTNSSAVGSGALSEVTLSNLNMTKIDTSAGTPTNPVCLASAGTSAPRDVHVIDGLCYVNDPGQPVAPIEFTLGITNLTIDNWTSIGSGFASDIEGPNVAINGFRDFGAATSQPSIDNQVSSASVLYMYGWNSNRGNIPFNTTVGATGWVAPSALTMSSSTGATVNVNGGLNAQQFDASISSTPDIYNTFTNTGSGAEYLSLQSSNFSAVQSVTGTGCWLAGAYGGSNYTLVDCQTAGAHQVLKVEKGAPDSSLTLQAAGNANFTTNVTVAGGSNVIYRCLTAGTLPIGALTSNAANCGTTIDTGLRTK